MYKDCIRLQIKHCLVLSCLVLSTKEWVYIGTVRGKNIGDLTIRQRIYVDVHEIVAEK